jgi:hypothetical protein
MAERNDIESSLNELLQPEGSRIMGRTVCRSRAGRGAPHRVGRDRQPGLHRRGHRRGRRDAAVHHGLFWRGQDGRLTGWLKQRVARLLAHDINLFAYHLPLDAHAELGNNAQLGPALGLQADARFGEQDLGFIGPAGTARPRGGAGRTRCRAGAGPRAAAAAG